MIVVDECNVWDKNGCKCHENVRKTRYFYGCDIDQLKEYLLTEAANRLNLDITKIELLLAFKPK